MAEMQALIGYTIEARRDPADRKAEEDRKIGNSLLAEHRDAVFEITTDSGETEEIFIGDFL